MKQITKKMLCIIWGCLLLIGVVLGTHLLDIGDIALFSGFPYMMNGFWQINAVKLFHIGMYLSWICGVLATISYILVIALSNDKNH